MIEYWQIAPVKICSSWLLFLAFDIISVSESSNSQGADVESHLEIGRDFLARGQLQDALSHYHAAVEGDPDNYLTYFKRGTVYLALGKAKFALLDFDKVLELKPDFHSARLQRGLLLMKQGEIHKSKDDLYHVYVSDPNNAQEAYDHYQKLDNIQYEIDSSHYYYENRDYFSAIQLLTKVIEACPWSPTLRELRSACHLERGDTEAAILDLRSATKLLTDNTEGFFKIAMLQYRLGKLADSLKEIRECLKLDPEHKNCFPHYKKVKKIDKLMTDAEEHINAKEYGLCAEKAKKMLLAEKEEPMIMFLAKQKLCHCYLHDEQFALSLQFCQEALDIHRTADVHCEKAEVYIATEMYEEAIHEFSKALEVDREYQRAINGQKRAQKLQKMAEKRDYYKILNVKRTATKQEIIKAYRKAAQKWHPDNFQGDEKKMAEKKFIDVAAAKEVLTDPEKRQKFDNGEDPLDPESGAHPQGFNPFQQFHQFHGSPFTFKFHFN